MKTTVAVIVTGIIAWSIATIIALAVNATAKVVWTCVVGVLLGFIGLRYSVKRLRRHGI